MQQAIGINHWIVIVAFVAGGLSLFAFLEKKGLQAGGLACIQTAIASAPKRLPRLN